MARYVIEIETGNDACETTTQIASILDAGVVELLRRYRTYHSLETEQGRDVIPLMDVNGNKVGSMSFVPEAKVIPMRKPRVSHPLTDSDFDCLGHRWKNPATWDDTLTVSRKMDVLGYSPTAMA